MIERIEDAKKITDRWYRALKVAIEELQDIADGCGPPENIAKYALEKLRGILDEPNRNAETE